LKARRNAPPSEVANLDYLRRGEWASETQITGMYKKLGDLEDFVSEGFQGLQEKMDDIADRIKIWNLVSSSSLQEQFICK
jgi:hypothetical protein